MVAMIEAPFRTALMPAPGGTDRGAPGVLSARARAVRMSAITGGTNREEVATATTGLLAEGWIHGVGVRARTSDWTSRRNRGTTDTTGSNGRSSRRSRGSGGHPGPHLRVLRRPYLSRTTGLRPRRGLWTLTPLWTHASTSGLENCSAVSHKRPQPSSSSIQSLKNTAPSSSYPSTPGQVSALSNGQRQVNVEIASDHYHAAAIAAKAGAGFAMHGSSRSASRKIARALARETDSGPGGGQARAGRDGSVEL